MRALVADHLLSLSGSGNPPDALDFYGPWKLLDALQDCATRRQDCQVALGGTAQASQPPEPRAVREER
jgi:hypothetical protein